MKNTIKAIALTVVLSFGATFANAGILVTDRSSNAAGILVTDRSDNAAGILVTDLSGRCSSVDRKVVVTDIFGTMASVMGILIADLTGSSQGCGERTTVNSRTRNGIPTDRATGILVTD